MNSVLAIGGVGGLAIGLAGREILENLFTGLIILSSSPFEVGEEVLFTPASGPVRHHPPTLLRTHGTLPCALIRSCTFKEARTCTGKPCSTRAVLELRCKRCWND